MNEFQLKSFNCYGNLSQVFECRMTKFINLFELLQKEINFDTLFLAIVTLLFVFLLFEITTIPFIFLGVKNI